MRPLLPLLLTLLASGVSSAEAALPAPAADQLRARLPQIELAERDGRLWWQTRDGAVAFAIADVEGDAALVETAIGRLPVPRKVLAVGETAVRALPPLVERARADGLAVDGLRLVNGVLTGLHLRGKDALVLPEGVLRRGEPGAERSAEVTAVAEAAKTLTAALPRTRLDAGGRASVAHVVARLADGPEQDAQRAIDEPDGAFLRRVVRHGWLAQVCGDLPEAQALTAAVAAAERPAPRERFASADGASSFVEQVDAFGDGGWVLRTTARSGYARRAATPEYHFHWNDVRLRLVVELAPGADPLAEQPEPLAAAVYQDDLRLASWRRGADGADQFTADADGWQVAVRDPGRISKEVARGFLPPHIMISDLDGDPLLLATPDGTVPAMRDGSVASGERFLAAATRALKDAAALDLIGEYFLTYVYDSPDSRFPMLIGNKENKGDIHQTVAQTLATTAGGQFRGDCDDLAELYEHLADRQGRTAHVIALPQHAAAAWAEQPADKEWHVYVLQTGRPEEHVAATLPEALRSAYIAFDAGGMFDPNALGLLLRFDEENTRSSWALSWRIFAEPDYAATMIDVQHDWHLQTYQRGIDKMLRMVAVGRKRGVDAATLAAEGRALIPRILAGKSLAEITAATPDGDHDNANFRELSGLYTFTGQYELAARFHRLAMAGTEGAANLANLRAELVGHLFNAGDQDGARAEAQTLIAGLRDLGKELGEIGQSQLGQGLAGVLAHHHAPDLAITALEQTALAKLPGVITTYANWLRTRYNERRWNNDSEMLAARRQMVGFVLTGTAVLAEAGPDALAKDRRLQELASACQNWFNDVAMRDADDAGEVMVRYAWAGRFYGAVLGDALFDGLLAQAQPADEPRADHVVRSGGLAQLRLDLPWIRASVPYWSGRMAELIERERTTLDAARMAQLATWLEAAAAASTKLGVTQHEATLHLGRTLAALVAKDEARLRERLRFVKEKDDKRLRDDTAQLLGDTARFLDPAWWQTVNRCWKEELDYGPKWFWIAWRAALNGGPKHALMTAEAAYASKKNDQFLAEPFKEELEFMRGLFGR